ncbi:MAG: alpha/beta hydrolase [Clostridia bacterium]|nr:alpha/beta hydrolase [Clostridia bacterium]
MKIKKEEFNVRSSDNIHDLAGIIYVPEGEPKGIFQIVHGMTEHIGRYDRFMTFMANNGYIVCGHDHLGHGRTAKSGEYGFFAEKKGYQRVVDDVALFGDAVREKFSKDLPYFLMGHSMGSFIARLTAAQYDRQDKLIVMGTGGPNKISGAGLCFIRLLKLFKGKRNYSTILDKVGFGSYNEHFIGENDPKSWISSIPEERHKTNDDVCCNFKFTLSAMEDLMMLNRLSNKKKWANSLNKNKPVLLVSGTEDPVGDYGEGVKKVCEMLKAAGVPVTMKLYKNARHEILNDISMDEVNKDILEFIEK